VPRDSEVVIRGESYPLVAEAQLPSGTRAWTRELRPSQPSDPGEPVLARWLLSGPNGNSREDVSQGNGVLSVDYTEGIDTLYDALALPGPKVWPIDLVSLSQSEFVETSNLTTVEAAFTSAEDDDAVGTVEWTNPENAIVGDGSYAEASEAGTTHYWKGLLPAVERVPSGANVTGVRLLVDRAAPDGDTEIDYVAQATSGGGVGGSNSLENSQSPAKPSGVTAGDVMLAFLNSGSFSPIPFVASVPSGWTLLTSTGQDSARHAVYMKVAGDSEPSSYTFRVQTNDSSNTTYTLWFSATIVAYRNVSGSPIDVTGTALMISGSGTFATAPSVTTTMNATRVIGFFAANGQGTWTPPTGMTERVDVQVGSGQSGHQTYSVSDVIQPSAGATGTKDATTSGNTSGRYGVLVALAPSAAPGTVEDATVSLVVGGSVVGDDRAKAGNWNGNPTRASYGASSDTWGLSLTREQVNAGDFGVALSATITDSTARLADAVMEVSYTETQILPVYTAEVGAFPVGAAPFGGGTASSVPLTVTHIDEDRGQVFWHGGAFSTQTDPAQEFVAVDAKIHASAVRGAAAWRNRGYLGLGPNTPMQRRTSVTTSESTYEDVTIGDEGIYAGPIVTGPDRIWYVDNEDEQEYALRFSIDAITNQSDRFLVGDPGLQATGLGTYGRSALVGAETGAYGFTDLGMPVRVLESLRGQRSARNAQDIITMWGWTYITTTQGLKATIPGQIENPAGLPRSFEGKPQGLPTAIWPYKDALFMAVKDVDGDTYIMRGEFGEATAGSGQPDWYSFAVIREDDVDAIFSTAQRPTSGLQPSSTLLIGIGANGGRVHLGRTERDIDDPDYRHATGELAWVGTTMLRSSNLHKNIKYFVLLAEDVGDNSIQVQVKVDDNDYVNVGDPVESSGHKFVRPIIDGVPQANVNGHIYKPRVIFTNSSEVNPPKLRGTLDMMLDVRPDNIWEHNIYVMVGQDRSIEQDIDNLTGLMEPHGGAAVPIEWVAPGEIQTRYGFVTKVQQVKDIAGDGVQAAIVTIQEWPVGDGHH